MNKIILLAAAIVMALCPAFAQTKTYWSKSSGLPDDQVKNARVLLNESKLFELDLAGLKKQLQTASVRGARVSSELVISFPTPLGDLERFKIMEAPVLHPDLAAKYPNIKSYAGQGIDDPTATIRFSISDQSGFHGMVL